MADNKIIFKVVVDDGGVITQLRATQKGYQDIDLTTKNAKNSAESLNNAVGRITKGGNLKNIKLTENEYKKLANTQNQLKNATGGASSAAMELGRVISDAPYGIRGMANNITQLVSQIGYQASATNTATGATYGYVGALKAMWTALMGPLGIVLAITTAVSALDFFFGAQKSAKESSEETTSELEKQRKKLDELTESYEDYLKLRERVVQTTSKEREMMKALVKETLDLTNSEERRQNALNKLIELYPKYFDGKNIDNIKGIFDAEKNVNRILQNKLKLKNALEKAEEVANEIQLERIKNEKLLAEGKRPNLDRIGELLEEQKQVRDLVGVYAALDLELKKDKEEKPDNKDKVRPMFDLDIIDPKKEAAKAKKRLDILKKWLERNLFPEGKFIDFSKDPKIDLDLFPLPTDEDKEKLRMSLEDYVDVYKEVLSGIGDFISAQHDRRLTKEQNHTNQLNEQLNNRLLNERLSVSERRNIQNQIAKNDEELRKKQNEIKKKQFNSQKAFNISSALIETYLAANKALQTFGGVPTGLPAMAATITAGLLNVATIASQKFQPEAASTPIRTASGGGGGGGVGNRTFDFNLVGNNQQNQLAEAIGGQFDRPLKAYVVSKDISNQQQLDANIKSSARFGG